jgi:hypothetical protein
MDLKGFLIALSSGGIALGPTIYLLFDRVSLCRKLSPKAKRFAVAFVSSALGLMGWTLAATFGFVPVPVDQAGYASIIWQSGIFTGFTAFMSSSLIHGAQLTDQNLRVSATTELQWPPPVLPREPVVPVSDQAERP